MASKSSLCWDCANACRKCPWSRDFKPVPGWEATPTKVYQAEGKYEDSFFVHSCPMFEKDNINSLAPISSAIIAEKLGVSRRTVQRMHMKELIEKCRQVGIELEVVYIKGQRKYFEKKLNNTRKFISLDILYQFWKTTGYTGF